jgi:hypothetical protein
MGNCFRQTGLISQEFRRPLSTSSTFDSVVQRMSCSKTEGPLATESATVSV